MCSPTSSAREDATRGKWQRIDKDVSKKIGVKYLYIYARESASPFPSSPSSVARFQSSDPKLTFFLPPGRLLPGSSADVITDLRLLNHTPSISDLSSDGVWVEVSTSLREGVWPRMSPLFLHYKLTPQADVRAARKMDATNGSAGLLEPITQLDVLYGGKEVHALPGFKKLEGMITGGADDEKRVGSGFPVVKNARVGASLAYRKEKYGSSSPPFFPNAVLTSSSHRSTSPPSPTLLLRRKLHRTSSGRFAFQRRSGRMSRRRPPTCRRVPKGWSGCVFPAVARDGARDDEAGSGGAQR